MITPMVKCGDIRKTEV